MRGSQIGRPGKILCIGRNYAAHAREMKADVPARPVVFLKPPTALIGDREEVIIPRTSVEVHHEVELVALIGCGGSNIAESDALCHVAGYAVGLDMTARDIQQDAKSRGLPWSVAKGFDTFAPLGAFLPTGEVADPQDMDLVLKVGGEVRQRSHTSLMLFSVRTLVAYCSTVFTLEPGDLIYTGTPKGVGPVVAGDVLIATCGELPSLQVTVRDAYV